jgi:arylsulfatase A-like enzyme
MTARALRIRNVLLIWIVLWGANSANGQQLKKPNILVIFGDDIGWFNVSAYNMGMMGYRTPNIDRIAHEGMLFTDY